VRLGDKGEFSACFNPETLTYDALWSGGFLTFSDIRHGFMDGLRPGGRLLSRPAGTKPDRPFVYHGYYRDGPRVVFSYRLGDVEMLDAPWVRDGQFERVVAPAATHPLRSALKGGSPQWPQELKTSGELGPDRPYTVDTIKLPFDNPWKVLFFFGDHDFLANGTAFLSTMMGDVWRVTGLDETLKDIRWRRFATGLHQPLGLVVSEGRIYVLGRDQITQLHDLNGDGEADFYECFSNRMVTSPSGHDFTCGLVRDSQGRFSTASGKQGLIRISADGKNVGSLGTGWVRLEHAASIDGRILTNGQSARGCSFKLQRGAGLHRQIQAIARVDGYGCASYDRRVVTRARHVAAHPGSACAPVSACGTSPRATADRSRENSISSRKRGSATHGPGAPCPARYRP